MMDEKKTIHLINTYKDDSYFYKTDSPSIRINKYEPWDTNLSLHFEDDNYKMEISHEDLHVDNSGNIYFETDDSKYIIDDGYRNILVRCGYLVKDHFDKVFVQNNDEGLEVSNYISKDIESYINNIIVKMECGEWLDDNISTIVDYGDINVNILSNTTGITFVRNEYLYMIKFCCVENLVDINQARKVNIQPFYPFDKNMDKFGTVFVCIYAQRLSDIALEKTKYDDADDILTDMVSFFNKRTSYHYKPMYIKKRIINNNLNNI